jgi:hypothetical protein
VDLLDQRAKCYQLMHEGGARRVSPYLSRFSRRRVALLHKSTSVVKLQSVSRRRSFFLFSAKAKTPFRNRSVRDGSVDLLGDALYCWAASKKIGLTRFCAKLIRPTMRLQSLMNSAHLGFRVCFRPRVASCIKEFCMLGERQAITAHYPD